MKPTKGRIVHYKLSSADIAAIDAKHRVSEDVASYAHGNPTSIGDVLPAIVVAVFPDEFGTGIPGVNLQVMLDGPETFWATSRREGNEAGQWAWPPRE